MTLNFLNPSRSYDATRNVVCFWGHESQFEVAFQIDADALNRISSDVRKDEASLLRAFDGNRGQIEKIAGRAFSRKRQGFYRLSLSDV